MIEPHVSNPVFNPVFDQAEFIKHYNAFIDKLTKTFPKKWFKDRKISTEKLDEDGFCGGDVEMCAYFHHRYGNLDKFFAYRSFFTEELGNAEQLQKLIDGYKKNDEFIIKIGDEEVSLWKFFILRI